MPKRKTIEEKLASEETKDAAIQTSQEVDDEEKEDVQEVKDCVPESLEKFLQKLPPKLAALAQEAAGQSQVFFSKKKKYSQQLLQAHSGRGGQSLYRKRFSGF